MNVIAPYRYTKIGSGSDSIGTLFGAPIPSNVTAVTIQQDAVNYQHKIRWRVRSDISDEIHEMELPDAATREHIQAVLTAMRLTC